MMGTLTVYLRSRRMLTYVYVYISDTSLGEQYTDSQGANPLGLCHDITTRQIQQGIVREVREVGNATQTICF